MEFENHHPIPSKPSTKAETLLSMKIGESFTVERKDATAWRCAMSKVMEQEPAHFISRSVDGGKIRIWRDG